ncbi:EF-hand calcium-binding domain-containing protein 1-like [Scaptodrosophila lebanonensis]|uniref:EF-hand calcium-binding domain-containing protein 1-like n=1 Tax=Drosophila lebanonensis TaxID=7225 RepID=A0A6J2TGZ5_DROLE|nr:EF-hand calcium-binding domain-containing protein 1-like [Scaptodrosophila lebanonensis]
MDNMSNTRFIALYHHLIKQYSANSTFREMEVASVLLIYYKFVLANGPLARKMQKQQLYNLFLVLFDINDRLITERILLTITTDAKYIDPLAWLNLLEIFMSTDLRVRMKFAFSVYNASGSGYLNRELIIQKVERFFDGQDEDEINELRSDMVDFLFLKFDLDKDGQISFDEYAEVVSKQPALLEFLGQCLPTNSGNFLIAHCANIYSFIDRLEI